jgi:hypothetical protein
MTAIRKTTTRTLLGVAAFGALVCIFAFPRPADAQTKTPLRVTSFAPVFTQPPDPGVTPPDPDVTPPDPDAPWVNKITLGLLLPAIQPSWTPFRIEAVAGDGVSAVLVTPPEPDRSMAFFDVFLESLARTGGFLLHLQNRKTGEEQTAETTSQGIVVRVLPAVQPNGTLVQPLSAGETVRGFAPAMLPDGTLFKLPFEYAPQTPPVPQ